MIERLTTVVMGLAVCIIGAKIKELQHLITLGTVIIGWAFPFPGDRAKAAPHKSAIDETKG